MSSVASEFDALFFFFFQAEDGIRDVAVTGVQTCALPILLVAVTVRFVVHVSAQTCTTCTNPPQLGRQDTWPQNTLVTVNISGSFTPEQIGCIEQAFTNWSNAGTHAGVVYQFTTNSQPASGSNAIQIWRETPPLTPTGDQPQADTSSYYNSGNTNLDHAV